jgi:hypothetical protein
MMNTFYYIDASVQNARGQAIQSGPDMPREMGNVECNIGTYSPFSLVRELSGADDDKPFECGSLFK